MSPTPPFAPSELRLVRRNPWILGLAASPALLVIAAVVAGLTVKAVFFGFVFHPLIIGVVALLYAWRRNPWPRIERAMVRADAGGVQVGERHLPRADIREGFVLPGLPPKVLLRRRRGLPVELEVGSTDEGRALLRALGLDVTQTVTRFRAMSRAVARKRYMASVMAAFFACYAGFIGNLTSRHTHGVSPTAALLLGLSVLVMMVVLLMPTRLSVGADGIVVSWFGRERFIGYADVLRVARYETGWGRSRYVGITVYLRSGEEVPIPTGQAQWSEQGAAVVEERIREAMEAHRSGGAAADAALLRRGSREVSDWVSALRAIGAGANADMRTAPLPRERLFRIVEDPGGAAADRAAAAVALGTDLDDESRARLRAAAEATAAPRLRVVIEAAAGSSEQAEIEAALAEVAQAEERTRASG